MSYIQKQLDHVEPKECELVAVQFASGPLRTNWLNLTPEQFAKVKALLIELKGNE